MPNDPNVFTTEWERDLGAARGTRLGAQAGATELGCAVYELDPRGQATPYHLHHGNAELLIVLEGRPELRTPAGRRTLEPGAVVSCPAGPEGAHRLRNATEERVRYLVVSTMRFPDVAEQLDTGTILAIADTGQGWAWPAGAEGDYIDLTLRAIRADPGDATPA